MKKMISMSLFVFLLIGLTAPAVFSQDAPSIRAKMIEALGGIKVLEAIKDTTITGTIEIVQQGLSGTINTYWKSPDKSRADIEVMGMLITQAYDGTTAWYINPQTGAVEDMTEDQAAQMKREAYGIASLITPEKFGITYSFKGKEAIEGKEYLILEAKHEDDFTSLSYIDPDTYLPYKSKATITNEMGMEVEVESFSSDYKKVNGMMMAHTQVSYMDGEEYINLTITEVKVNTGLEDDFFSK